MNNDEIIKNIKSLEYRNNKIFNHILIRIEEDKFGNCNIDNERFILYYLLQ